MRPAGSDPPPRRNVPVRFQYQPFSEQIRLHLAARTYRERVAVTGSRGGKTTAGVADTLDKAISQPGYSLDDYDAGEPYTIFVGAPTYSMIDRVILPAILRQIPPGLIASPYNHQRREISIFGSGVHGASTLTTIYFLSSGLSAGISDRWKGVKAYFVWLDEFPLMKEGMYDEARTRLLDRGGSLLLTGTPHGLNWAYDRIKKPFDEDQLRARAGQRLERPELFFTTWRTVDNKRLPQGVRDEIEQHRRTMPAKYFARTYEASWDVFGGQIYDEWLEAQHVVRADDYMFISARRSIGLGKTVVRLERVIAGIDWGYADDHPGVILVLGRTHDGVWYLLEESVASGVNVLGRSALDDSWVRRALTLRAKWGVEVFYADPQAPGNFAYFRDARIRIEPALNDTKPGIACVARCMHIDEDAYARGELSSRLYVLDTCRVFMSEVRHYHWEENTRKEVPAKIMDHTMDAIRYALYTFERRQPAGGRLAAFEFADAQR